MLGSDNLKDQAPMLDDFIEEAIEDDWLS